MYGDQQDPLTSRPRVTVHSDHVIVPIVRSQAWSRGEEELANYAWNGSSRLVGLNSYHHIVIVMACRASHISGSIKVLCTCRSSSG